MVMRYTEFESALNSMDHGTLLEYGIYELLLLRDESERVHSLLRVLNDFEGVTKILPRSTLTLSGVRRLFDQVTQWYPKVRPPLSVTAAIVNNDALESGIIKLQRKEPLRPAERVACSDFHLPQPPPPSDLSLVQQVFKKRKVAKRSRYSDVVFVPPTSYECVRFFSAAKLVYSNLRMRTDALTLEMLMFPVYNKDMWNVYTVEAIRA
ncbi:hypothetical protein PHMEG_0006513 [Phytophthora megakarya]|uniref:HAT C-terminal dimerisation domain-containing protein n=1 Tax=Phytophthora megakarya TaxID=4795 RepID=A0A225WNM5_9STRA|nr:hypothetical protein PHMEG_0006513 [Phytophthora megakarya]